MDTMSERKHHEKEKQLILDSYTNEREDGQRTEMKGVLQQVKSEHKAVPLQLSAHPCHLPLGPLGPMGVSNKVPPVLPGT